jgi:hypothetical protein
MLYPTMGTSADNPTATIYGNFKCPFTQDFVWGNLQDIIEEYVVTGKLNIRFRQLAYEPNKGVQTHSQPGTFISLSDPQIGAASLAVWDISPEDYWSYFFNMFSELVSGTVTAEDLGERMAAAGVDNIGEILTRVESGRYSDLVRQSTYDARDLDVNHTPRLEMGGVIENPRHETEDILNWVDSHLSEAVPHLPQEDTDETQTEDPSKTESDEPQSEQTITTITFDGSTARGWAHYEFTVSGDFETSRTMSASVGKGDAISGSTAKGGVGPWKDSYTFTGKITDLELTQPIDVLLNGEITDLDELNAEVEKNKFEAQSTSAKDKKEVKTGFKTKDRCLHSKDGCHHSSC